jgi:hypothetical protein
MQGPFQICPYTGTIILPNIRITGLPENGSGYPDYHATGVSPELQLFLRMQQMQEMNKYDEGHLGAINVSLNTVTHGDMGMTKEEAKTAVRKTRESNKRNGQRN